MTPVDERRTVRAMLRAAPPIVTGPEIERLRGQLAAAARGETFVLHVAHLGRDEEVARAHLWLLSVLSTVITYATGRSVVVIAYDGDAGPARHGADGARLMHEYASAAGGMNLLRALHPVPPDRPQPGRAEALLAALPSGSPLSLGLARSLRFAASTGHTAPVPREFYAAHDAALLDFERDLLRRRGQPPTLYASSAHLLWIRPQDGDLGRVAAEFTGLVANPVGLVADPAAVDLLAGKLARFDPPCRNGRMVVRVRPDDDSLARLLASTRRHDIAAVWLCDADTVDPDTFAGALADALRTHRTAGSHLGGVHLDLRRLNAATATQLALRTGEVLYDG